MELIELCHIRVTVQSIGMCGCDKESERLDCCEKASGINLKFNGKTKVKEKGKYMNEKFFDLKKEKQDRMINASLKIFALNGYKHASTDDIVTEAGISKGLLFHYFGSKLGLYTFLYDYSVRFMKLELTRGVVETNNKADYFELRKQIEFAKMQVLKHRVECRMRIRRFLILFNPADTGDPHIGRHFHGVGAPWGYHLLSRADESAADFACFQRGCFAEKPRKPGDVVR